MRSHREKGLLGRVGRNSAALFAVGSAFLAAALPAAEFVKGIYELRAKAQEHADQIELEFLRLITNAATQPPDRRRILEVLLAEGSNSPLQRWAQNEAHLYDEQINKYEGLYRQRQQAGKDSDARRRAWQIASVDLETRQQEMDQLIHDKADPSLLHAKQTEIDRMQERTQSLQSEYAVSATLVAVVATPASATANPPAPDSRGSASGSLTTTVALRNPTACNDFLAADFKGLGAYLTANDLKEVAASLGIEPASLYAITVEASSGYGFVAGRPKVLFERHIFHRLTGGHFSDSNPDISSPTLGGYGPGGSHQYERIKQAMALDCAAALEATSWGIFQTLGENINRMGFDYLDDFIKAMMESERSQFNAFAAFLRSNNELLDSLQRRDWAAFARVYFGPNYSENRYDTRLASAYNAFLRNQDAMNKQSEPDEQTGITQGQLKKLGYYHGPADGRLTEDFYWAVRGFQGEHGRIPDGRVGPQTQAAIAACVAGPSECPGR
jgi:hypothetical protein